MPAASPKTGASPLRQIKSTSRPAFGIDLMKRLFDLTTASLASLVAAPIVLCAAAAVKLSSSGPAFYKASRAGQGGQPFTMWKLRTMHCRDTAGSSITASEDPRVFFVGKVLRKLKIDELPQLINIFRGEMSVVGPRPEATDIVENHFTDEFRRTLDVKPGLTSPGAVYYYTEGERILSESTGDPEQVYLDTILPAKMQLELNYQQNASLLGDLRIIADTAMVLLGKVLPISVRASEIQAADDARADSAVAAVEQRGVVPAESRPSKVA